MARFLDDTSNHYIQGAVTGWNTGTGTVLIRMRPYWRSLDSTDHIAWNVEASGSVGASSISLERYSDNNIYVGVIEGGSKRIVVADAAGIFQAGRYKTYVYTWDQPNSSQQFFAGGARIGTSGVAFTMPAIDQLCIGRFRNGTSPGARADIEEFAAWSVVLSPADILRLERGDSPSLIRPAARLGYFPILGLAREINVWRGTQLDVGAGAPAIGGGRVRRERYDADVVSGGGTITGAGDAAGVGAATATGAATAAGAGSAAGAGVATATGAATGAGVGGAAGTSTATAVGASTAIVAGVGAADGTSTAAAVGAATGIISAVGNAAGSSDALGVSLTTGAGGERRKRKRIEWVPPDHDIETRERTPQPGEPDEPASDQPQHPPQPQPAPSVKLGKAARKLAQAVARARSGDPATAERARAFLDTIRANADSDLARLLAHQQAMELQRRGAQAAAAEDDDAVRAFMQWLMRQ